VGFLVLGALLLMAWRQHRREPFFGLRRETADPGLLDGTVEPAAALAGTD
jgi:hypothetical protein